MEGWRNNVIILKSQKLKVIIKTNEENKLANYFKDDNSLKLKEERNGRWQKGEKEERKEKREEGSKGERRKGEARKGGREGSKHQSGCPKIHFIFSS